MNAREKVLAGLVGGLVGILALGFGGRAFFLKPLRDADKKISALRDKLNKVNGERRAFFAAEDEVKKYTQQAFDTDIDTASAKSAELLTRQILQAGLPEMEFSRLPVGPRKLRGAQEIGWNVQGDGPLNNVVNLLFLLQEEPHLHRIDGVTVTADEGPGLVRVRFRYLTLVIDPAPEVEPIALQPKFTLNSPERRWFDGIVQRDILRAYVKRAPALAVGAPPAGAPPGTPGAPPGPETLKIVSLSEWQGQPEVHVRDMINQKTLRFKPGDALAGGTIVMVDYRAMPMPGNEALQSFSRVIIRVGEEFWAIEHGKTLAEKRRLKSDEVPAGLASLQTGQSAAR